MGLKVGCGTFHHPQSGRAGTEDTLTFQSRIRCSLVYLRPSGLFLVEAYETLYGGTATQPAQRLQASLGKHMSALTTSFSPGGPVSPYN